MSLVAPQPAPRASEAAPLWPIVIEEARTRLAGRAVPLLLVDMAERDAFGRAKYPFPLAPKNGRDFLVDLYQEVLDACVYSRGEMEEGDPSGVAEDTYDLLLRRAFLIRTALLRREQARCAVMDALAEHETRLPVGGWPQAASHQLVATGLDSLDAVSVALAIEEALDIDPIPDEELRACVTVGDLALAAERAQARKAARP